MNLEDEVDNKKLDSFDASDQNSIFKTSVSDFKIHDSWEC
jgi:hypothetical protein